MPSELVRLSLNGIALDGSGTGSLSSGVNRVLHRCLGGGDPGYGYAVWTAGHIVQAQVVEELY